MWVRQFFTLAVARDLYAGAPRIYVNYLDYDVSAHAFGAAGEKSPSGRARTGQAIGVLGIRASPFLRVRRHLMPIAKPGTSSGAARVLDLTL